MSIVQPLIVLPFTKRSIITVAADGFGDFGFGGGFGAIDTGSLPKGAFSRGSSSILINQAYSTPGTWDFTLVIQQTGAAPPQNLFELITVVNGAGAVVVLTSAAAANYFTSSNEAFWQWGAGTSPVWNAAVGNKELRILNGK